MFAKVKPYLVTGAVVLVVMGLVAHFAPESLKSKIRV